MRKKASQDLNRIMGSKAENVWAFWVVWANFAKQNFNRVPSASLDEAKTWLAGEISLWKKITQEVPVELQQ